MSGVSSDCEFEKIETAGHERLVSATSLSENNVDECTDIGVDMLDFDESNRKPDTDKNSECDIDNELGTSDLKADKKEMKSGTGTSDKDVDKDEKGTDLDSNENSSTDIDKKTEASASDVDVTNDTDLNNDLNVNYNKKDTEAVTSDLDETNDVIKDSSNDNKDTEAEYFSDESESGDEYESAEEGEDIQTDSINLKELEETLTEEEKEPFSLVASTNDNKGTEAKYFSDESESGDEYESAEEGEDIQTDSINLKELEETLTEEEKEATEVEYFSDESESGDEYESAEEGEEIQTDSTNLKELEETLTEEEKEASSNDNKATEVEYFSDESESGDEYESAEEGEDIQTDSTNLKELEETLTEEEKEERRNASREMKEEGNQLFKVGSYKSAIRLYSRGLRTCPLKYEKDRSVLYANRGACKVKLEEFEAAIRDCSKALDLNPDYMKVLQRRAELYENADKLDEALVDYQKILELDPGQHKARAACMKLPEMIKERNEKLKEEMMGKLKDLGNMVLRPFGLSTNNFKMQQDPNTGGYSVNFVQNPDNGS